ncbi:amidohydrolase family protein [Ottowia thiooxydans]|uniref:amidohydrolase family protein n=1 Tax=Ottowia thiooxydans TaxID=219182 RepID=UPI0004094DB4|nr:amidohydrolase family protein [Ottowia thiooxydans]
MGDAAPLNLVDAHHHLWDLKAHRYPWLQDAVEPNFFLGDYAGIRRDYLPGDYRNDTRHHKVIATVHVEAERARDDQVGETAWLHRQHARHGLPNAVVAHAWFHTPEAEEVLAAQAAWPLVKGIRSKPVTSATPDAPPPRGAGSMHDPQWLRGFSLLEQHGFSWDLRVPYWHLAEAAEVARQFPNTPIVLNHTGFPWNRSAEGIAAWRTAMEELARQPNVHVKISELGLRDLPWTIESNRGVVRDTITIFGMERCMFASNFPVAGLRIGYDALIEAMQQILADFTASERDAFFRRNALNFYRISPPDLQGDKP